MKFIDNAFVKQLVLKMEQQLEEDRNHISSQPQILRLTPTIFFRQEKAGQSIGRKIEVDLSCQQVTELPDRRSTGHHLVHAFH